MQVKWIRLKNKQPKLGSYIVFIHEYSSDPYFLHWIEGKKENFEYQWDHIYWFYAHKFLKLLKNPAPERRKQYIEEARRQRVNLHGLKDNYDLNVKPSI